MEMVVTSRSCGQNNIGDKSKGIGKSKGKNFQLFTILIRIR